MKLTPVLVARSQLLTAIELFFDDCDPVSVYALAGAADEMLEDLCRDGGIEPMTEIIRKDHPGKSRQDIWRARNLYRNAFKHVGRTPTERSNHQAALDQFNEKPVEFLLYVSVADYFKLRRAGPVPFQVFQAWFCAMHPELIATPKDREHFRGPFPSTIAELSRAEQKRLGKEMVASYIEDQDLLADPLTEPLLVDQ